LLQYLDITQERENWNVIGYPSIQDAKVWLVGMVP